LRTITLKIALTLALLTTPLAGCKTEVFSRLCPPLKEYNQEFRTKLAAEMTEALGKYPTILQVITDYGVTRDDIRACIKRSSKPGLS
jgi:hypothetical protein